MFLYNILWHNKMRKYVTRLRLVTSAPENLLNRVGWLLANLRGFLLWRANYRAPVISGRTHKFWFLHFDFWFELLPRIWNDYSVLCVLYSIFTILMKTAQKTSEIRIFRLKISVTYHFQIRWRTFHEYW